MILLIGLVTKNSILLVEYANQLKRTGLDATAAMVRSGAIRAASWRSILTSRTTRPH